MNIDLRFLCFLLCVMIAAGCGKESPRSEVEARFQSWQCEYYATFYRMAIDEAMDPDEDREPGEVARIEESVRESSIRWSSAVSEGLTLRKSGEFVFEFFDFDDIPKGRRMVDASIEGSKKRYQGKWAKTGSRLVLRVESVDGNVLSGAYDWETVWKGSMLVIPAWRSTGPFRRSVLTLVL